MPKGVTRREPNNSPTYDPPLRENETRDDGRHIYCSTEREIRVDTDMAEGDILSIVTSCSSNETNTEESVFDKISTAIGEATNGWSPHANNRHRQFPSKKSPLPTPSSSAGFKAFGFFSTGTSNKEVMKRNYILDREPIVSPSSLRGAKISEDSYSISLANFSELFAPSRRRELAKLITEKRWKDLIHQLDDSGKLIHRDNSTTTLLHAACEACAPIDVIDKILQLQPSAASASDTNGNLPLHIYCLFGTNVKILRLIIKGYRGAAHTRNKASEFPLQLLLERGMPVEWYQILLDAYPPAATFSDENGSFPLHYCMKNRTEANFVRKLINAYPGAVLIQNKYGATPLFRAVSLNAPIDILKEIIAPCPRMVTVRNEFATCCITQIWDLHHVASQDVVSDNEFSKNMNISTDSWERIELLLRAAYHDSVEDPPPAGEVWRAVHAAAAISAPTDVLQFAIGLYHHQVRLGDELGRLPIHLAASTSFPISHSHIGHKSPLDILVATYPRGTKRFDKKGRLPLHYALESGKNLEEGVEALLAENPVSATVRDSFTGLFPFMLAARYQDSPEKMAEKEEFYKQRACEQCFIDGLDVFSEADTMKHVQKLKEDEEKSRIATLYRVIRTAPGLLSCGVISMPDDGEVLELRAKNREMREKNMYLKKILRGVCTQLDALDAKHEKKKSELEIEIKRLRHSLKMMNISVTIDDGHSSKKFFPSEIRDDPPLKSIMLRKEKSLCVKTDPRKKYRKSRVSFKPDSICNLN